MYPFITVLKVLQNVIALVAQMSRNMMVCSSITLQITHVRETSLYLAESFLSPFLYIGQTFPFRQSSGRSCSVSDWLNMTVKHGAIWGAHAFRACDSILPGSLFFIELTFFKRSSMSLVVMVSFVVLG